jgi:hypothetical protein
MDLDTLPARVLAGLAGGRAALGRRARCGRPAAHHVEQPSCRPHAL